MKEDILGSPHSTTHRRRETKIRSGCALPNNEPHPDDRVGDAMATAEADADDDDESIKIVRRNKTRRLLERTHFQMVNERVVEDITVDFLYKPHTLTILALLVVFISYKAFTGFTEEENATDRNVSDGLLGTLALFLVVSAMSFPNGPFIRPHPVFWRTVFGVSVVYLMLLQFTLFQTYKDIKAVLTWLDPKGLGAENLVEKEYAINCSDVSLERLWSHMDIFAVGHFTGWAMKALLIRHGVLCWYISIAWELTEIVFTQLLPNFAECWWDAIILDVLICNGLGIFAGLQICKWLSMRNYHWESIKHIKTNRARFKRMVLQFTPESWNDFDWGSFTMTIKRTMAVYVFVLIWLLTELNTFFMKHVFSVDTKHPVVFWRLILIAFISAPSIRQFYLYATDPLIKRLGMQCWVYLAVCALEAAICVKFGISMFPRVAVTPIIVWILFLIVGTFMSVWFSVWLARKSSATAEVKIDGENWDVYLDSSAENLGAIHDDVRRRRRDLGFSESDLN